MVSVRALARLLIFHLFFHFVNMGFLVNVARNSVRSYLFFLLRVRVRQRRNDAVLNGIFRCASISNEIRRREALAVGAFRFLVG